MATGPHAFTASRSPRNRSSSSRAIGWIAGVTTMIATTVAAGCGGSSEPSATGAGSVAADATITVVVTTSIWGDIVERSYGELVDVEVLMPDDADPHHFAASVKQAASLEEADLIVANGAGLEAGLASALSAAESSGVPVFTVTDHVDTLPIGDPGHGAENDQDSDDPTGDDPAGDDHDDDAHADDDHEGEDPHVWLDPTLVAAAVEALGGELESIGVAAAREQAAGYVDELTGLDQQIADRVATVPAGQRKLVTNHDSLEYFAHRYGFEVVTTVVGSVTTDAEPSAAALERVAETINSTGVRAVFVENKESRQLAEAVVAEAGTEVAVVELITDGLGGNDGYLAMMTSNSDRIVEALT